MVAVRLPRTYDEQLLKRDLAQLQDVPQVPQAGPYHAGDWTGIDLYAQAGSIGEDPRRHLYPAAPTPALERAPYIAEILAELDSPKLLARLLTLPPGAEIGEHTDAEANFQSGAARLHIPVVTHPDIVMVIDGTRMVWREGELWWGDFSRPHWLRNDSSVVRVHLVVDIEINEFVLGLFPPDFVAAKQREGGITMRRPRIATTDEELASLACEFVLPSRLMPLFKTGSLRDLARDAPAACHPEGGRLIVDLDGEPAFALERVAPTTFAIAGHPPGFFVEFDVADGRPRRVEVVLRGVPSDLYAAKLGVEQGDVVPEQRFPLAVQAPPPG